MSNFYRDFKENMAGLGLPAPEGLFGTVQAAVANASVILVIVGLGLAGLAWGLWDYLGEDALSATVTLSLIVTVADNIRLRRRLRNNQTK